MLKVIALHSPQAWGIPTCLASTISRRIGCGTTLASCPPNPPPVSSLKIGSLQIGETPTISTQSAISCGGFGTYVGFGPRTGNHQNLRGQAAGIVERLLQPCCMTDAQTAPEQGSALQLKARLPGISPMIWRRVLVPETMPLHELHGVLQVATGWEAIHLFQFSVRGVVPADALVKGRSSPHAPDRNPCA